MYNRQKIPLAKTFVFNPSIAAIVQIYLVQNDFTSKTGANDDFV